MDADENLQTKSRLGLLVEPGDQKTDISYDYCSDQKKTESSNFCYSSGSETETLDHDQLLLNNQLLSNNRSSSEIQSSRSADNQWDYQSSWFDRAGSLQSELSLSSSALSSSASSSSASSLSASSSSASSLSASSELDQEVPNIRRSNRLLVRRQTGNSSRV